MTYVIPEEQRAIADYLDRETARIDALIAAKQRMLDVLGERMRALVEESMCGPTVTRIRLRRLL